MNHNHKWFGLVWNLSYKILQPSRLVCHVVIEWSDTQFPRNFIVETPTIQIVLLVPSTNANGCRSLHFIFETNPKPFMVDWLWMNILYFTKLVILYPHTCTSTKPMFLKVPQTNLDGCRNLYHKFQTNPNHLWILSSMF